MRSRERASKLAGSIEKLQTNALQLSEQMDWLRSIKMFSETILDGSPTGFGVWNAAGEYVHANQLIYRMIPGFEKKADFIDFFMAVGRRFGDTEDDELLRHLALVSRVVTLHGGNVVASNLLQGTRITFLLPLESESKGPVFGLGLSV
ncbi:MAG: hypothetical protein ACI8VW_000270 [bacterium]